MTQMYGPAVRCKRFRRAVGCGLASMYPAFDWSGLGLRAIMDISARAISLADRPRAGHSGHQCSHAPGRPILHLFVSSRRPRRDLFSMSPTCSLSHSVPSHAVPLFVPRGRSFVPACTSSLVSRAGAVKAGRRARLSAGTGIARPRLDGSEHGANLTPVGRLHLPCASSRRCGPWPAPPRRCGRACWRARSPARCDASASCAPRSRLSAHAAPSSAA
jgi:hypothetical protein